MDILQMKEQILDRILAKNLVHATISQPRQKSNELKRIKLKPVEIKGQYMIQLENQFERILKHENVPLDQMTTTLDNIINE